MLELPLIRFVTSVYFYYQMSYLKSVIKFDFTKFQLINIISIKINHVQ